MNSAFMLSGRTEHLYGATTGGSDKYCKYNIYAVYHFVLHTVTCIISHRTITLYFLHYKSVLATEMSTNPCLQINRYSEDK